MMEGMHAPARDRDLAWADALARAVAARTGNIAAMTVAPLSRRVGDAFGLSPEDTRTLELTARLHDIGKLALSDAILSKPGPLLDAEIVMVRDHPAIGATMLDGLPGLEATRAAARATHERFDGAGYPLGLRGDDVPVAARIVAAADAYVAMISRRPWRDPLTEPEALEELSLGAGRLYDPAVVEQFVATALTPA